MSLLQKIILCSLIFFCIIPNIFAEQKLKASWYSSSSLKKEGTFAYSHGKCADGSYFNENALTCASRLYPLGTTLKVTNLKNKKSVVVKVTDRIGKRFATSRIDLSKAAFERIAELRQGLVEITVEVL